MQSLAQTQMLLENVWAENYHDFGEFSRQSQLLDHSSFNVPLTRDLFGHVNGDLSNDAIWWWRGLAQGRWPQGA